VIKRNGLDYTTNSYVGGVCRQSALYLRLLKRFYHELQKNINKYNKVVSDVIIGK
jgi:hypothetical protein